MNLKESVSVCVCVYLSSCSIQGLSYIRVVLFLYLYLSSFSFSWCTSIAIITSTFSPFHVSILLWEKLYFFVSFKQVVFWSLWEDLCNHFIDLLLFNILILNILKQTDKKKCYNFVSIMFRESFGSTISECTFVSRPIFT